MYISIDFDGTVVQHKFPLIGEDIGAVPWLKKFKNAGALLLLNTMRNNNRLVEAVQWFVKNDIKLYGINYNPDQASWDSSNKVYANLYIDDANFGCPLKNGYVDWDIVGPAVLKLIENSKRYAIVG
jgi:hypothetical protein